MDNESAGDTFGVPCHRFQCPAPRGVDFSSCHQSVAPVILNSRSKPASPNRFVHLLSNEVCRSKILSRVTVPKSCSA
jgi:hypothetical protein